jgi:hypothetical protein
LELNADKTEILILNKKTAENFRITYNKQRHEITSVLEMKICGLFYCSDPDLEYKHNVVSKMESLTIQIKKWIPRNLTMEGKILIVKTFGISQLIYNMQSFEFKDLEIINIERIIFKFIWATSTNQNGIDRIKRSIMKNDYLKGGMQVTDIDCLNRSLKLKQFIRAYKTNHVISDIQAMLTSRGGNEKYACHEYANITEDESICKAAQETINHITDFNRKMHETADEEISNTDKYLIDKIASIDLETYLTQKNESLCNAWSNLSFKEV